MKIMATLFRLSDSRVTWRADSHFVPPGAVVVGALMAVAEDLRFIQAAEAPDSAAVCDVGDGGEGQEFPSIPHMRHS